MSEQSGVVVLRDQASGAEAEVVAEVGSNLHRFRARVGGKHVEVLASAPDLATLRERSTRFGSAPLFPYPGRVEHGRFTFEGREITLPTVADGNAIHGVVRARPWRVVEQSTSSVTTEFDSAAAGVPASEWPWPFVLRLTTTLRGNTVRVEIEATNRGDSDMPIGLGFHPYFPASPEHEVWVDADERGAQRGQGIPTGEKQPETQLTKPTALKDIPATIQMAEGSVRNLLFVKNGGGISAGVRGGGFQTRLTSSEGFGALVFFTPVSPPVVSLEPHTVVPNGFNVGQMVVLKPGETWRGWYQLEANAL
jgi:aldose 1-epimerase